MKKTITISINPKIGNLYKDISGMEYQVDAIFDTYIIIIPERTSIPRHVNYITFFRMFGDTVGY